MLLDACPQRGAIVKLDTRVAGGCCAQGQCETVWHFSTEQFYHRLQRFRPFDDGKYLGDKYAKKNFENQNGI